MAVAVDMWVNGDQDAAICVLLARECYLRAGEAVRLCVSDFADPQTNPNLGELSEQQGVACIRLATTKTGRNQFVTIRDPLVLDLMRRHVAGKRGH